MLKKRHKKGASGTVLMEFIMAFPIVLTLMLAVVQFAHICIARQVVHYAAYSAARVAMVTADFQQEPDSNLESLPNRSQLTYSGFYPNVTQGSIGLSAPGGGTARSEAEYYASEAAARICSSITLSESIDDYNNRVNFPGEKQAFSAARRKTRAVVDFNSATWNIEATVEHDFALVVPIVGQMLGWGLVLWSDNPDDVYQIAGADETGNVHTNQDAISYPHIRLTETVLMSKPYRTVIAEGDRHP